MCVKFEQTGILIGYQQQECQHVHQCIKKLRVDMDRMTVTPNTKRKINPNSKYMDQNDPINPFHASDDEDTESDSALLAHLVKGISDVGFDDTDLDTRI